MDFVEIIPYIITALGGGSAGWLYIDGLYYCDTLEDKDRGLKQTDPETYIKSRKVAGMEAAHRKRRCIQSRGQGVPQRQALGL